MNLSLHMIIKLEKAVQNVAWNKQSRSFEASEGKYLCAVFHAAVT